MKEALILSCGAIPGALIRWQLNNNLLVNIVGSAILGFLLAIQSSSNIKLFLAIGFCGSLTTFSGWILSCLNFLINGFIYKAIYNLMSAVLLGLFFVYMGFPILNQ